VLAHHVLLGLSVAAIGGFAVRVASLSVPTGLERALAASATGATAAGAEALALGLVGVGTNPVALGVAAGATWLAGLLWLPRPEVSPSGELVGWWRDSTPAVRGVLGALAGIGAITSVWLLRHPALGVDSVTYHLPEVVAWVDGGTPGSTLPGLLAPASNRPLMDEVLLAWAAGLSRSFVPVSLLVPAMLLLLAGAGWAGLRALNVGRAVTAVAVATICLTPVLTYYQLHGAYTDLPALAWLATAAALCAASLRRPALLAPAVLAAGLALGTKTTVLPMTLLVLALTLWAHRGRLRELGAPLALAATVAVALAGFWYLRDMVRHGSPFWPEVAAPWGDPSPIEGARFLYHPVTTLDRLHDDYRDVFLGSAMLLASALLAPLLVRSREVLIGAAATAAGIVIWMGAPATGVAEGAEAVGTVAALRYLTPILAAAAVTLALASREGERARLLAAGALTAALVVSAWQTLDLGFPHVPSAGTLLLGAVAGLAAALAASWLLGLRLPSLGPGAAMATTALVAAAAGAVLTPAASGYLARHARANTGTTYAGEDAVAWLASNRSFEDGDEPVAVFPVPNGALAGDRLRHPLDVIDQAESCRRLAERLRTGWVVVDSAAVAERTRVGRCLARVRPAFAGADARVYAPP
jgi:hypothetical protein